VSRLLRVCDPDGTLPVTEPTAEPLLAAGTAAATKSARYSTGPRRVSDLASSRDTCICEMRPARQSESVSLTRRT